MTAQLNSRLPIGPGLSVLLIAAAIFSALSVPLIVPLLDPFHEGEYLSPHLYFGSGANGLPLLIHGMINYLPAQWAASVCGSDYIVVCTRIANMWLAAAASAIWALSATGLMRSRRTAWLSGLASVLLLLLFNGTRVEPVSLHQGAPSVRDLALLCELAALLGVVRGARPRLLALLLAVAGVATAAGLLWAYTRGLVGVLALAGGLALAYYSGRSLRTILIAPFSFLATLSVLYLHDAAMFGQHFTNIQYWSQHREIWSQPFPVKSTVYVAAYACLAIVAILRSVQLYLAGSRSDADTLLLLLIPVSAILYQSLGRADINHMMWVMPFAYLLAAALIATFTWPLHISAGQYRIALAAIGFMIVLVLAFQALHRPNSLLAHGPESNLALATRPLPTDDALIGSTARRIGALLRSTGQSCTYAMNNGGAYYEAAGLPPCTPAMYPVYAADRHAERRIIIDLQRARPLLVIGHDGSWSDAIDGKPMPHRTPVLSAWLDRRYPVAGYVDMVEIRRRRDD